MVIENENDLEELKKIGRIVALAREEMIKYIKPGITTAELDAMGEKILTQYGAHSAPKSEYDFPGTTCISINDVAAHGIPGKRAIKEGDLVNIDISAELNGYFADTGISIPVEPVASVGKRLCDCSKSAFFKGIEKAKAGAKINQIGRAIYNEAKRNGFTVIKDLTGHGIGKKLHDDPQYIPNYFNKSIDGLLANGVVLAVETFISTKAERVYEEDDGWTLRTTDGSLVAQYEHTIIVTQGEPIILTML
ncbi:type I methionyl aminopeptidase [Clostridium sp. DJ247]|uniref:type I methionyl aminopeptidase n=1 Tax=Clostridium sp. DJ247 TaxID=2726188 RepID=UPI00162AC558|nr:type I methionyl aminopeptidase [Clostridium sp. DJ247]MBC2581466.1 type I methionyl aminopeptidase [Clostridium sp. DJ247]